MFLTKLPSAGLDWRDLMKNFLLSCLIVLAIFCGTACSSDPSSSEQTSDSKVATAAQSAASSDGVTIAAFVRGPAADEAAATAFEQGMELAAEDKSATKINRRVLTRAQGLPSDSAFQPLLASVPLVVYWQTSDLISSAPTLKESNVIAVPVWNVTEKVASLGTNVFGFGYSTERSFAELAKFAGSKLKSYRFAVFSSSAEPFSTQSDAFIEETKSQGNTIVFQEKVESADADFKSLIARAKKEQCDTLFAVLPGNSLVAFIKAARAASFGGKILVGDSFFAAERAALGKDAEGIYLLQSWSDDPTLKERYSTKYGAEPDGITLGAAALGYDLIRCIEAAGANPDSGSISYSWLSTPCNGLTGKTMFSGERIAQRQKQILTVKGDKFGLAG